jgi:hypothetical protein
MRAPKKYPDELRERAVREVAESGRPIAHLAAIWVCTTRPYKTGYARPRPTAASVATG